MVDKARFYLSVDPGVHTGLSVIRVSEKRLQVLARKTLSMEAAATGGFHRCFTEWLSRFPITRVTIEEFTLIKKVRQTDRQRVAWDHAYSIQQEAIGLASFYHLRFFLIKPDTTGLITTRHRDVIAQHVDGSLGRFSRHVLDTIVFVMKVEGLFQSITLNAKVIEESTLQAMDWEERCFQTDASKEQMCPITGRLRVHVSPFGQYATLRELLQNQGQEIFGGSLEVHAA